MSVEEELLLWNEFHSLEDLRDDFEDAVRQYSETLTTARRQWHLRRSHNSLRSAHIDPNSRNVALARSNQQARATTHILDTLTISFLESRLYPISPVNTGSGGFGHRQRLSSDRLITISSSDATQQATSTPPPAARNDAMREDVKGNVLKMGALVEDLDDSIYHVFEDVVRSLDTRYGGSEVAGINGGASSSAPNGSLASNAPALDYLRKILKSRAGKGGDGRPTEASATISEVDRRYCLAKLHKQMMHLKTYSGDEFGVLDEDGVNGLSVEDQVSQLANSVEALQDYAQHIIQPSLNVLEETLYKVEECIGGEPFKGLEQDASLSSPRCEGERSSPDMSFQEAVAFLARFRRKVLSRRRNEKKRLIAQRPPSPDVHQHADPFGPLRLAAAPSNGIFSPKADLLVNDEDQRNYVALRLETDQCVEAIVANSGSLPSSSSNQGDAPTLDSTPLQLVNDALHAVASERRVTEALLQFLHDTNYKLLVQQHDDSRAPSASQSVRSSTCSPSRASSRSASPEVSPRRRSSMELLLGNNRGNSEVRSEEDVKEQQALTIVRNSLRSNHAVLSEQMNAAMNFGSHCNAWLAPLKEFYASTQTQEHVDVSTQASIALAQERLRKMKQAARDREHADRPRESEDSPTVESSPVSSRRESSDFSAPEPRPPLFFQGTSIKLPPAKGSSIATVPSPEKHATAPGNGNTSMLYEEAARHALLFLRSYRRWDSSVTVSALIPGSPPADNCAQIQSPVPLLPTKSLSPLVEEKSVGDIKAEDNASTENGVSTHDAADSLYGLCVRSFNHTLSAFWELWTACKVPRPPSADESRSADVVENVEVNRESFFGVWRREIFRVLMSNLFSNRWQSDALLVVLFSIEDTIRETLDARLRNCAPALFAGSGSSSSSSSAVELPRTAENAPNTAVSVFIAHILRDPLVSEGYQSYIPGFKPCTPESSSTMNAGAAASICHSPHFTEVIQQETTRLILSVYGFLSLYERGIRHDDEEGGKRLETLDVSLSFETHQLARTLSHATAVTHMNKQWDAFLDAIWFQYDPVGSASAGCMAKVETGDAAHNYGFINISRLTLSRVEPFGSTEHLCVTLHYAIQPEHGGAGRTLKEVFSQSSWAPTSREPPASATCTTAGRSGPLKRNSTCVMQHSSKVADLPQSPLQFEWTQSSASSPPDSNKVSHACVSSFSTTFAFLRRVLDTFSKLEQRRLWHLQHLYQCKESDVDTYSISEFTYVLCFLNLRSNKRCSFSDVVLKSSTAGETDLNMSSSRSASFSHSLGHSVAEASHSPLKTALSRRNHTFVGLVPPPAIRLLRESRREETSGTESHRVNKEVPFPLTTGVLIAGMLEEAAQCEDPPLNSMLTLAKSLRVACMAQIEEDRVRSMDDAGRLYAVDPRALSMKPEGQKWLVEPILRRVDELISCDFLEEMLLAGAEELESSSELDRSLMKNPLGGGVGADHARKHAHPDSSYSLPFIFPELNFAFPDASSIAPQGNRRTIQRDSPHLHRHMSLFSSRTFPSISTYSGDSGTSSYSVSQSTIASAHCVPQIHSMAHAEHVVIPVKRDWQSHSHSHGIRRASGETPKAEKETSAPIAQPEVRNGPAAAAAARNSPSRVTSQMPAKLVSRTASPSPVAAKGNTGSRSQSALRSLDYEQLRGRTRVSPTRVHKMPSLIRRGLSSENRQGTPSRPRASVPKSVETHQKGSPRSSEELVFTRSAEYPEKPNGVPLTKMWLNADRTSTQLPTFLSRDFSEGTGVAGYSTEEGLAESRVLGGCTTPSMSQLRKENEDIDDEALPSSAPRMHSPPARPPATYFEISRVVDRGRSPVVSRPEPLSRAAAYLSPRTQKHSMMCTMMLPTSIRRSESPLAREQQQQQQHTRSPSGRILVQSKRLNTPRGASPCAENSSSSRSGTPRTHHQLHADALVKPVWPKSAVIKRYSPASVYASQSVDAIRFSPTPERVGNGNSTSHGYSADRYQDLTLSP